MKRLMRLVSFDSCSPFKLSLVHSWSSLPVYQCLSQPQRPLSSISHSCPFIPSPSPPPLPQSLKDLMQVRAAYAKTNDLRQKTDDQESCVSAKTILILSAMFQKH